MRLHVVDGTYELFRAHYAKRPRHTAPNGQPVKATVGFTMSMLALLDDVDEAVTHVAVAFDNPIESFRNDLFDGYKTGEGMDPDLVAQMDLVERAARAIGMTVWSMDRWEADDALGTAAVRWRDDVDQVRIMTPDKDLGQSVCGDRVVLVDRMRKKVANEAAIRERRGVGPASIPDLLALIGDSADGIPGLPGFGEKGAASVLATYEHIENIPDDAASWTCKVRGADRLAATLADRRQDALLYRTLATLAVDVPLEESLDDLAYAGVPQGEFAALCDSLGHERLAARPTRWR